MIISLRGTSGSGKSTVVYTLFDRYGKQEVLGTTGKVEGYRIDLPYTDKPLYVVGRYTTACGGCDTVKTQQEIVDRTVRYHKLGGHVLLEGLLMSGGLGTVGTLAELYPDEHVFATLDTPFETCLDRVIKRRAKAGNDKPLNPTNTKSKFDSTRNVMKKVLAAGKKAVWIDHTRATDAVEDLLK